MANTQVSVLVELFQSGRDHTLKIVESVPESHRFKQLQAGKATPIWLLGHLTRTVDRLILEWVLQQSPAMATDLGPLFAPEHAGGIAPSTNPDDYPSWETLKDLYMEVTDRAIAGLGALEDEDLAKPIPGAMPDDYRVRFPDIGSLMRLLQNHDAYHRGQMGLLAKLN